MSDLFKAGVAYTEELEKIHKSMKKKAELKTAREAASERQDARRRKPFRESDPWV